MFVSLPTVKYQRKNHINVLLCVVINEKGNPYKNILDIQRPLPNLLTKTVVNEEC